LEPSKPERLAESSALLINIFPGRLASRWLWMRWGFILHPFQPSPNTSWLGVGLFERMTHGFADEILTCEPEMKHAGTFHAVADIVLITHVAFVAFIVVGLLLILLGGFLGWEWIRNPWFRILHLAGIGVVVVQSWLGLACPLTSLEMSLREKAGDTTYGDSFISHWLQHLLYFNAPPWVFAVCYTLFSVVVVGSWLWFRPRSIR
jgi:hypothetical protein